MTAPGEDLGIYSNVRVRGMRPSDIPGVSSILEESPEASKWSGESLLQSAQEGNAWVAEQDGPVIGFLIGRAVADEFEILNLAVAQSFRRQGAAKRLLETMAACLRTTGTRHAYLEVRASNQAAIALYTRHGFRPCGRRARYYEYPQEDAVVLSWDCEKDKAR
jgi:[ribosomal protein S18]-alanine N-acetyltransferase